MAKFPKGITNVLDAVEEELVASGKRVDDFSYDKELETLASTKANHRWLSRRSLKSNEFQGALAEASRKMNAQIEGSTEIANRITSSMTKEDAKDLNTLVVMGREYQTIFDDAKLDAWGMSDITKKGYKQYIHDSDVAHVAANSIDRKVKEAKGWGTNKLGDTAKEFNSGQLPSKYHEMNILDPETGDLLNFRNTPVEKIKEDYLQRGYKLYQIHPDEEISRGLGYTHYLSKAEDEIGPLAKYTLPYVKGGSNGYTPYTHFVKIGRDFYDNEGGKLFHGYTKTLIADENVKRLEKYAEEVNKVSDMWNRNQGDLAAIQRELDAANFQEFKVTSAADVKDLIRNRENPTGLIDPNYKAQVLRQDEKYVYEDKGWGLEQSEDFDQAMSDRAQLMGSYYRSRGDEILANLNHDYGHVIDATTMWQRNIEQAAQNNTLNRLMVDYGEWFKETFRPVIDTQMGRYNINRMSGPEVIASAKIVAPNSSYDTLAAAAKRAQAVYGNILNAPTELDIHISNFMTSILHKLPKRWWDSKFMDWAKKNNPVNWANMVVYRNYLGCFNAKQFLLQGPFQMINTVSLSPLHGTQAAVSLPAILMGHFFKDTPVVKYIPKLLAGIGGISPKQYEAFMKFIEDYGTFKQFSKRPELTQSMETWLKTWPDIDLIFAQAGNNLAQLHADLTAFLIDGGRNMRNICRLSDDFMLNLNRINTSTVQRTSIGRVAAQFTSYPMAAYEIMFGDHLKGWQRASFVAAQIGMWGIGGTFAKDYVTNLYNFASQYLPNIDPHEASLAIEGMMTQYFAELGIDINEGTDLLGMFNQLSSLISVMGDIFGGSAPELPISNVPTILVDNYNAARDLIAPKTGVLDFLNWCKESSRKKGFASGFKNITRTIYAHDARVFLDRHGEALRKNPTRLQEVASLLGFGPIEGKLNYRAVLEENNIRQAVRETFEKDLLPYINEYVTFRDTGKGDKEIMQSRTESWGYLLGNTRAATRRFYGWILESHPEMYKYAKTLVKGAYEAGQDKKYNRSKPQQKYYEQDIQRIKSQE